MTGEIITAEEACRIGLVNHVTAPQDLMDRTMELARKIAALPVLPVKMMKTSIDSAMNDRLIDTLHRQAAYQAICYMSNDIQEGIDAIREKRRPFFKDEY